MTMIQAKIMDYLDTELPKTVRRHKENEGRLIGLPYPYNVPAAEDNMQEMYYWDTYFTNHGLILRGDVEQAKCNVENLFYLLEQYGFVPNGNDICLLHNSQPPFLSLMARDIYDVEQDKSWLPRVIHALEKEYVFWQEKRGTNTGLNRYDGNPTTSAFCDKYADALIARLGFCPDDDRTALTRGMYAVAESGWDITPRLRHEGYRYNTVDLNSLLYGLEDNLSFFWMELGDEVKSQKWREAANHRAKLCRTYLLDENTNLYYDYNFETREKNGLFSVASLFPLFVGMATKEEAAAAENALERLETQHGILTCEKNDIKGNYQWDYPNGWAPLQYVTVSALKRYGYEEHALRIAEKFVRTVENCFESTGHLWEKYNIVEGTTQTVNEYGLPAMLGWTFGVYTTFITYLGRK